MITILQTATTRPAANTSYAPRSHRPAPAPATKPAPAQFEAGRTYWTRSICDHECIFRITVARRTAKTIVTTAGKRLRISLDHNGVESVMPHGRYSMAAVISADRVEA